jgi:hypothetical protein
MTGTYGPAGMFSTDNPQADQNQIECEQYDPSEGIEEPDEIICEDKVLISARCLGSDWYAYQDIYPQNYQDLTERFISEHNSECNCGNPENLIIDSLPA